MVYSVPAGMSEGGVHVKEPELAIEEAMVVPALKVLLAPYRNCSVTVPEVVGDQVKVVGEPALSE